MSIVNAVPKSHTQLAHKIIDFLKQQDLRIGERIREQPIADYFSVSRTPVRGALAILAEQGVLDYVPKQGFSLAQGTDTVWAKNVALPLTEDDTLFRAIMRDRLANRLDFQITVKEIMRRYSCSRAVVAHVFGQMSRDGLIERGAGQSWVFGPALVSLSAAEESFRFRLLAEPAAILEPGFRLDSSLFHRIRQHHMELLDSDMDNMDTARIYQADAAFHNAIASCCNNRFLAQALRQQTRLRELSGGATNMNSHRLTESCREHIRILDAIEAGQRERAAELMRLHIRGSQDQRPRVSIRGIPPLANRSR